MFHGRIRSIPTLIVLCFLTCGLYPLVWYYEISSELQDALGRRDITPGVEVLLIFITCGLYTVYWWYRYGRMVAELQATHGLPVHDNAVMLCVLSALSPFVIWNDLIGMCILQSELNGVWEATSWRP